jgi:hypothetical protein
MDIQTFYVGESMVNIKAYSTLPQDSLVLAHLYIYIKRHERARAVSGSVQLV